MASSFRDNDCSNPTLDEDGNLGRLLSHQFRAFKNKDPAPKQQKALPSIALKELFNKNATEQQQALANLAIGAFFFACRSCEYLKVWEQEKRRTDVLRLRDICFRKNGIELKHSNPALEFGDSVSNTFERQKKDKRMDTVTHLASGDPILCPV